MTLRANLRAAEQLLADLEADLGGASPQETQRGEAPTALELLDLYYLRWLTQRIIHRLRARARQRSGATRHGYRKLGA